MANRPMVDTSEVAAFAKELDRKSGVIGAAAASVVRKTSGAIVTTAKQLAPVDTGATRDSIGADIEGDGRYASMSAVIGPTTEHAPVVEFGSVDTAPQPFMGPALDQHTPGFVKALEQIVDL